MAAAPVPTPEPDIGPEPSAGGSDADGWALLEGLRRRLDDHGAASKQTQLQVTQLAESIAALVAAQRRRERRLNLNSFIAYLIFTVLCGAGCYLLYTMRARELVDARDRAVVDRDAAVRRADDAGGRLAARDAADAKAWTVWELLEAGKRAEAMAALDALAAAPLSKTERAVLAARAHETQVMEVDAALKAAAAAWKAGRAAEVAAPLEAALARDPGGPKAPAMHYYAGVAYAKLGELDKAIAHLTAAVAADGGEEDARFQLASALDRSGAWGKARQEYDRFATAHPQSPLAGFAMRRSATLAHAPAVAPVAPKPGGVAPPAIPFVPPKPAVPAPAVAPKPAPAPPPKPPTSEPAPGGSEPLPPTAAP